MTGTKHSTGRRVLLTSNGLSTRIIRGEFERLLRLRQPDLAQARVLYIPDALVAEGSPYAHAVADFEAHLRRDFNISHVEACELARVEDPTELRSKVDRADCIYVECGNTFYIHYHSVQAGLKELLDSFLADGGLYVGSSAGTIVAGKTAAIALWKGWDSPSVVPKIDYDGLDLLGGRSFFPHYSSQYKSLVDKESKALDHPTVTLTDSQCLSVDESGERLLG